MIEHTIMDNFNEQTTFINVDKRAFFSIEIYDLEKVDERVYFKIATRKETNRKKPYS